MNFIERILMVPDHNEPPVMLAYLAAQLDNYDVRIGDLDMEWEPDMVVLQCNELANIEYVAVTAKMIKDGDDDIHVVAVGKMVADHYKEMGEYVDWFLSGYADHAIQILCNLQNSDKKSEPTGYPDEYPVFNVDKLPWPDWDCVDNIEKYFAENRVLPVVATRGDTTRDKEDIKAEMQTVKDKYNLDWVELVRR